MAEITGERLQTTKSTVEIQLNSYNAHKFWWIKLSKNQERMKKNYRKIIMTINLIGALKKSKFIYLDLTYENIGVVFVSSILSESNTPSLLSALYYKMWDIFKPKRSFKLLIIPFKILGKCHHNHKQQEVIFESSCTLCEIFLEGQQFIFAEKLISRDHVVSSDRELEIQGDRR